MPLLLARRKILVSVLVLLVLSGVVYFSGYQHEEVLSQMRKYTERPKFNNVFESSHYESSGGTLSMVEKVSEYLGNSQMIDPLDGKPMAGVDDPDLQEKATKAKSKTTPKPKSKSKGKPKPSSQPSDVSQPKQNMQPKARPKPKPKSNSMSPDLRSSPSGQPSQVKEVPSDDAVETADDDKSSAKGVNTLPGFESSQSETPNSKEDDGEDIFVSGKVTIAKVPEKQYPALPEPSVESVKKKLAFRFYSHNVKNGAHEDLDIGELPWTLRKQGIINSIKQNAVANTIVFLQEPIKSQLDDIMGGLNMFSPPGAPEWTYFGGGRIDGVSEGEHVPIILRTSEWQVIYNDTMWLNGENPRSSLVGWDAKYPRIATFVTLRHLQTGNYLNLVNTHFDHKGKTARSESAKLLISKMKSINKWPSFLMGDLNALPNDDSHKQLSKSYVDIHDLVPNYSRYGHPDYSVTGFSGKYLRDAKRIDYIFAPRYTKRLSEKICEDKTAFALQLQGYGLLHSKYGGSYISDHRPLLADFVMVPCA